MNVSDMRIEIILSILIKCLQSKEKIKLNAGFFFLFLIITIQQDCGGSRYKISNISLDRLNKKCILSIPTDDLGLCAKVILFAMAYMEKDRAAINTLKDKRRPALMNRAKQLYEEPKFQSDHPLMQKLQYLKTFLNLQIQLLLQQRTVRTKYFFSSCDCKI